MDAHHDTEIWNEPIYGYRYTYFNPQTKAPTASLPEASIDIRDFSSDKFKRNRSSATRSVVGVAMDLTYVSETAPSAGATDRPANDALVTIHYLYDLELDSAHNIIGGEWYSNAHPGFLWSTLILPLHRHVRFYTESFSMQRILCTGKLLKMSEDPS